MNIDDRLSDRLAVALLREPLDGDVELAVVLSVATRIEPELIRAVRLHVLPNRDVGAEADFWFSDWIGARGPHAVALRPALLESLREQLARRLADCKKGHPLHRLGDVIADVHRDLSPALLIEEQLTWRAVRGDRSDAIDLLDRVATTLEDPGRDGLAEWVLGASRRLPRDLLPTPVGRRLLKLARNHRPDEVFPVMRTTEVGVSWHDDEVIFGPVTDATMAVLKVPDTNPQRLRVFTSDDIAGTEVAVTEGETSSVRVSGDNTRVATIDGSVYQLPGSTAHSVQAQQRVFRVVTVVATRREPVGFWLEPVEFDVERHDSSAMPSRLLTGTGIALRADEREIGKLRNWRDGPGDRGVCLLHGRSHDERIRLADQFAARSARDAWSVYRARRPDDVPFQGAASRSPAAQSSVLVVVDEADRWPTVRLRDLLLGVSDALSSDTVRILLLAGSSGFWWESLTTALAEDGSPDIAVQRMDARFVTEDEARVAFRKAVEVAADMLNLSDTSMVSQPAGLSGATGPLSIRLAAVTAVLDTLTGRQDTDRTAFSRRLMRYEYQRMVSLRADGKIDTDPAVLSKVMFLACLMRPLRYPVARVALVWFKLVRTEAEFRVVIRDYESCYPAPQAGVLDPLQPEELGGDLLDAVLCDGDRDLGADPEWAVEVVTRLAAAAEDDRLAPGVHNAIETLARSAERHPRLADSYLLPLMHSRPELIVSAGAAALEAATRLAGSDLLRRLDDALPGDIPADLYLPAARIAQDLADHQLAGDLTRAQRAELHARLGSRLRRAGLWKRSLHAIRTAAEEYRVLAMANREFGLPRARVLIILSDLLGRLGEPKEALAAAEEARRLVQRHAQDDLRPIEVDMAAALVNLSRRWAESRVDGADQAARQAVDVLRKLTEISGRLYLPDLAEALINLSKLPASDALPAAEEAVAICRTLGAENPLAYEALLATALASNGARQPDTGVSSAALEESVSIWRRLAAAAPDRFQPDLADALIELGARSAGAGDYRAGLAAGEEATTLCRRFAQATPSMYQPLLARALLVVGQARLGLGQHAAAVEVLTDAVQLGGGERAAALLAEAQRRRMR